MILKPQPIRLLMLTLAGMAVAYVVGLAFNGWELERISLLTPVVWALLVLWGVSTGKRAGRIEYRDGKIYGASGSGDGVILDARLLESPSVLEQSWFQRIKGVHELRGPAGKIVIRRAAYDATELTEFLRQIEYARY